MKKYSHSKLKNTYLIFEFLIRQLTTELITESDLKKSRMFNIIKSYFSTGILKEELKLYQALINNHIPREYVADKLISECVDRYQKLNKDILDKVRYHLIGEIKKYYDINKLFSVKIDDYKQAGNVYFLFESIRNGDIIEKSKQSGIILEQIVSEPATNKTVKLFESIKQASPENRQLAYMILVERFNRKYDGVLNEGQKKYIKDYVYNLNNNKGWVNKHLNKVLKEVKSYTKLLNDGNNQDRILSIKINECANKVGYIKNKKIMDKEDHYKIILTYKLLEQLNEITN